jgi:hypothetical protein
VSLLVVVFIEGIPQKKTTKQNFFSNNDPQSDSSLVIVLTGIQKLHHTNTTKHVPPQNMYHNRFHAPLVSRLRSLSRTVPRTLRCSAPVLKTAPTIAKTAAPLALKEKNRMKISVNKRFHRQTSNQRVKEPDQQYNEMGTVLGTKNYEENHYPNKPPPQQNHYPNKITTPKNHCYPKKICYPKKHCYPKPPFSLPNIPSMTGSINVLGDKMSPLLLISNCDMNCSCSRCVYFMSVAAAVFVGRRNFFF